MSSARVRYTTHPFLFFYIFLYSVNYCYFCSSNESVNRYSRGDKECKICH